MHGAGLKNFDSDISRQLHVVPGQHPMAVNYTKENDSNLAPVFRQCDNFNERAENSGSYYTKQQAHR